MGGAWACLSRRCAARRPLETLGREMATKAADPFKGAVQMLRAAVEAEKKAQVGNAEARPDAIHLYMEANVLLDRVF